MKLPGGSKLLNRRTIFVAVVLTLLFAVAIYCTMIVSLVLWGSVDHIPAKYTYTVSIQDLSSCTSDGFVEMLVPVPVVNGEPFFSDEELNKTQGGWHSVAKSTEHGRMISLTSTDRALCSCVISYSKTTPEPVTAHSSEDVRLSVFTKEANQEPEVFKEKLAMYENVTGGTASYSSSIDYDHENGRMLGNTLVIINGKIWKPEPRKTITVHLSFEALGPVPDGCQPPMFVICSATEMSETDNSTYTPVAMSYGWFSQDLSSSSRNRTTVR